MIMLNKNVIHKVVKHIIQKIVHQHIVVIIIIIKYYIFIIFRFVNLYVCIIIIKFNVIKQMNVFGIQFIIYVYHIFQKLKLYK